MEMEIVVAPDELYKCSQKVLAELLLEALPELRARLDWLNTRPPTDVICAQRAHLRLLIDRINLERQ